MLIEVRDVTYRYPQSVTALNGVTLSIDRGERIGLIGHNGSGKSTLARHLNGLLKPDKGEVLIDGRPTGKAKVAELAAIVALLFQNPDDQLCRRSVRDEVAFGPENLGHPADRVAVLVDEALAGINPYDLGLSGRKRLALASVVAMDTGCLVLDEPTAGLDPAETRSLTGVLAALGEQGKAVIVISHDMDFVAENCDRAVCLEAGVKRFDGRLADLFAEAELLKRCGLLQPQMARLAECCSIRPESFTPEGVLAALPR